MNEAVYWCIATITFPHSTSPPSAHTCLPSLVPLYALSSHPTKALPAPSLPYPLTAPLSLHPWCTGHYWTHSASQVFNFFFAFITIFFFFPQDCRWTFWKCHSKVGVPTTWRWERGWIMPWIVTTGRRMMTPWRRCFGWGSGSLSTSGSPLGAQQVSHLGGCITKGQILLQVAGVRIKTIDAALPTAYIHLICQAIVVKVNLFEENKIVELRTFWSNK